MTLQLEGVIVPTITPRSHSKVDLPSLSKLLDFLIDGGVDIVFILGTTGEFQHIPVDYKCDVVSHTVKHVGGRIPVIVGISAKDMDEMFVLIEESEQSGAQGLVLAPMFGEDNPLNIVRRALDMSFIAHHPVQQSGDSSGPESAGGHRRAFCSAPKNHRHQGQFRQCRLLC